MQIGTAFYGLALKNKVGLHIAAFARIRGGLRYREHTSV